MWQEIICREMKNQLKLKKRSHFAWWYNVLMAMSWQREGRKYMKNLP